MVDIFDDIVTEKPEDAAVLTLEELGRVLDRLTPADPFPDRWNSRAPLVVADPGQLEAAGCVPLREDAH